MIKQVFKFAIASMVFLPVSALALTQNVESSDPIVGVYSWFNRAKVEFAANQVIYCQTDKWTTCGTWQHNQSGSYTLIWFEGKYIDTLTLSSDQSTLDGTNQDGIHVTGLRIR